MTKKNQGIAGLFALGLVAIAGTAYATVEHDAATTRSEAQAHATEMFARLDANKDGKLDPADRAAHRTAMFEGIDANKDGSISRAEFDAAHPGPGGHEAMDDGPGGHQAMGGHPGREGKHPRMGRGGHGMGGMMLVGMADANKDGAVTAAEFNAAALAHFDKADANHDGTLTRDERRAAHEEMRKHMREMRGAGAPPPAA